MKESFIDYSMSVIVARALPDVRDGLKPVHRRILYSMSEIGLGPGRPYKKSATVVGDVLGKYHPHGDTAVYDAMVRMVQPFSLRYPLVDGHGTTLRDGDSAAATNTRLGWPRSRPRSATSHEHVDYVPIKTTAQEPSVLPARFRLSATGPSGSRSAWRPHPPQTRRS